MIATSYLSVTAIALPEERVEGQRPPEALVGFFALSDYPRGGRTEDWLTWFSETYAPADAEVTMTNVLWVDFAVACGATSEDESSERLKEGAAPVVDDIVRTVFNTLPEIDYLVLSLPESDDRNMNDSAACLQGAFAELARHVDEPSNNLDKDLRTTSLFLCDRAAFLPTLAVSAIALCHE